VFVRSWIRYREEQLARSSDLPKQFEPLAYGLECLPGAARPGDPLAALRAWVDRALPESDAFFEPGPPPDYQLTRQVLSFPSSIATESMENNTVVCRLHEADRRERAVLILPHWNATAAGFGTFAGLLRGQGISALRMSLPYHDERRPPSMTYAQYMVSANLGRTIRSFQQGVCDARLAIRWLRDRGYTRIGIIGSSLGSAIGSVVAAKEPLVDALVLVMTASHVGEVAWTGRATRHIRQALEGKISREALNDVWSIISPLTYAAELRARDVPVLVLSGREDRVFLPHLTERIVDAYRADGLRVRWRTLPCGHYTFATFPFNISTFVNVSKFLSDNL
jgi:pimeloyl-ACP methyl ester carboxylesterase